MSADASPHMTSSVPRMALRHPLNSRKCGGNFP
jgi:hypothetical protein